MIRYNSSFLLKQLNENITYSGGEVNQGNVTFILNLFYQNLSDYNLEEEIYDTIVEEIEEYDLFGFNTNREP